MIRLSRKSLARFNVRLTHGEIGLKRLQNDQIEALTMERTSLYRKCRMEEIDIPLKGGNLRSVLMEEVRLHHMNKPILTVSQNFREEIAMDMDEDEGISQRPRKAQDYGIVVDFDGVDNDDLAVCTVPSRNAPCTERALEC
jgi:hypothetical protein